MRKLGIIINNKSLRVRQMRIKRSRSFNFMIWIASSLTFLAMTCPFLLILSSLFLLPSSSHSADLGEIEVTAPDDAPRVDESADVEVVKPVPGEIRSSTELIEQTPGVYVKRYGSNEDTATISIRGAPANQINIFYDNVPLNSASGDTIDFTLLPPENIERIEIYKGGAPARAPDPSPAGAIFFTTHGRPKKFKLNASAGYGSFQTIKSYLQVTQPFEKIWYLATVDYSHSKGDFTYLDDNGTRTRTSDDTIRTRQNNDYAAFNLFTKMGFNTGDFELTASNTFFLKKQGVPGLGLFKSSSARLHTDRNITILNTSYKKTTGTFFFDFLDSKFKDPYGDIGLGRQDNDDTTYRFGLEAAQVFDQLKYNSFYASITQRGEFYLPKNYASPSRVSGSLSWRQQVGLTAEDTISLLNDRLIFNPTIRFNALFNHLSSDDPSTSTASSASNDKNDYQWTGKFGLKARAVSELYFKGNIYRGFRNPDFGELFGDRGMIIGNPNLKPERSLNMDAGLLYDISNMGLLDRLKVEATYFRNSTKDLIQFIQTSQFIAKPENIASSLIQGFEGAVLISYVSHVSHSISYTYQDPKDTSGTVTDGKTLPGRPKNQLWFDTSLHNKWGRLYGEYNYMGGNYLDTQNIFEVTGRHFLNLGATATPAKWVIINLTIKNLTNDRTFDVIGFPLPGRSYWGSATFSI